MQEEEEIRIPGYEAIYWNDKTSNSGGIIIAVKDTVKTVTMQVMLETEVGQALWILLNNQKKENKSRSDTPNKELKRLYTSIMEEIVKAEGEDQ